MRRGRRVDIFTEHKGCGDRWRLYVSGVLPSCWRDIVSALEQQGEAVLVTATPGKSGLGRHVYISSNAA